MQLERLEFEFDTGIGDVLVISEDDDIEAI